MTSQTIQINSTLPLNEIDQELLREQLDIAYAEEVGIAEAEFNISAENNAI